MCLDSNHTATQLHRHTVTLTRTPDQCVAFLECIESLTVRNERMAKVTKTNVMRILTQQKIPYTIHQYFGDDVQSGIDVAEKMGASPTQMFKTLVTQAKSGEHYVFMVPVQFELDLKKAAQAVDEKSIAMIKEKELFPLTGYVHGGCSPIGMKKQFQTVLDESALNYTTILFSAGKIGNSVQLAPRALETVIPLKIADIIFK